jgi:hypothetical protein
MAYRRAAPLGSSATTADPLEPGRDLQKHLKPLASQRGFEIGETRDVPSRTVEPRDEAAGNRVARARKDDRDRSRLPLEGNNRRGPECHDDVGLQADQLLRERWYSIGVMAVPPKVHPHVAAIRPTQIRKRLRERREATHRHGIIFVIRHEHADAPDAVALLRARRYGPRRRTPEPRNEFPPSHP